MRYAFQIGEKEAEVSCDDSLTMEELNVAKEMLIKLIETRITEIRKQEKIRLPLTTDIDNFYPELSIRAGRILKRNGCNTIADVLNCTIEELKNMPNMGKRSLEEIQTIFGAYGNFKNAGD